MSDKFRIYTEKLKFTYDDIEYHWFGGLGCIFSSKERGKHKIGDIRCIGNVLFRIYSIERRFFYKEISWTIVENKDFDFIRELKKYIFGCDK